MDKRPAIWDGMAMWRHKLEALKLGMQVFKRIVYLDFDCVATAPLPQDFWHLAEARAPIQASLTGYKRVLTLGRTEDHRKVPNGGFIYVRDRGIPGELIGMWERNHVGKFWWADEALMAAYMDSTTGGWKGVEHYFSWFEPDYFTNEYKTGYRLHPHLKKALEPCFHHFMTTTERAWLFSKVDAGEKPAWWK